MDNQNNPSGSNSKIISNNNNDSVENNSDDLIDQNQLYVWIQQESGESEHLETLEEQQE